MTKSKTRFIVSALLVAALFVLLVVFYDQNLSLQRQLAEARASVAKSLPNSQVLTDKLSRIDDTELQRLRSEHLELLRLRGRVGQLASELRKRNSTAADASPGAISPLEHSEIDSILFTSASTNRVGSGNTLVVGGWSVGGMRRYLLLTPTIDQTEPSTGGRQFTIQNQVIVAPENFWETIGWGSYKSDRRQSALSGVITPDQLSSLIDSARTTTGAEISGGPPAAGQDGKPIGFALTVADEQGTGLLLDLDAYPRLSPDGRSVDLELRPSSASTKVPLHGSLFEQRAGQSGSPR